MSKRDKLSGVLISLAIIAIIGFTGAYEHDNIQWSTYLTQVIVCVAVISAGIIISDSK